MEGIMDAQGPEQKPPISSEEIERAAREIRAAKSLAEMGTLLLQTILAWCEPALVACFKRDSESDAGWLRVAELSSKALPAGIEATFRKLIDEAPRHAFQVPTLIKPLDGIAGITVKPRDNWVVPWTASETASGFLLVRGVARPHPPNLGQAVAEAAAPIWTSIAAKEAAPEAAEAPPADADALDRTAEELVRLVAHLRSEVTGAGRRLAAAKAEATLVAAAKGEAEQARALAAARERELAEAREAGLTQLGAVEAERAAAREEAAAAKAAADAAQASLEAAKASAETVQAAASERAKQAEELKAQVAQLEARLSEEAKVRAEAEAALREEMERLRASVEERQAEASKAREAAATAEQSAGAAGAERDTAKAEADALRNRIEELEKQAAAAVSSPSTGESALREEAERLRAELGARNDDLTLAREAIASVESKIAELQQAKQAAESERSDAVAEAEALRAGIEAAKRQIAAREDELVDHKTLQDRVQELEQQLVARTAVEGERDAARAEAEGLRARLAAGGAAEAGAAASASEMEARVQALSKELEQAKAAADEAVQAQEEARSGLKRAELSLAYKEAELEETRRHVGALEQRLSSAGGERPESEGDTAALAAQLDEAKARADAAQHQAESLRTRLAQTEPALEGARRMAEEAAERAAVAERERDEAKASASAARASEKAHGEGLDARTSETVRSALLALRRTPFVPPTLRIAFSGVEDLFPADKPAAGRPGPVPRLLLLDRDVTSLEPVAADLEQLGIDALLAHYPEEVSFFLKTPDARRLSGVVCDVMAFRSDQDLLDLFRAWRRDLPSLTVVLSFQPEIPTESQRVQRVPARTAGSVPRPVSRSAIVEALRKAQADRGGAEGPAGPSRTPPGR
jgi:chromosome segregation ATPase